VSPRATAAEARYVEDRRYVLAVLARRCGWLEPGEREAVLHDAFLVLLRKQAAGRLDTAAMDPRELRAYLVQTAVNKALDVGKRAERRRSGPLGWEALAVADPAPTPFDHAAAGFERAQVRALVAELPRRQAAVVALRFYLEQTPAEIQRQLGISERTYRRTLERAMRTLCADASGSPLGARPTIGIGDRCAEEP
jgi:RNA polymerase sigma factor (sigma-70 family)